MGKTALFVAVCSIFMAAIVLGTCPTGWHQFRAERRCFFLSLENETFAGASAICRLLGEMEGRRAFLATVDNEQTTQYLAGQILKTSPPNNAFYIGMNDIQKDGVWVWAEHGRRVSYPNWGKLQPNNRGGVELCAAIRNEPYQDYNFTVTDDPCTAEYRYICEMSSIGATIG